MKREELEKMTQTIFHEVSRQSIFGLGGFAGREYARQSADKTTTMLADKIAERLAPKEINLTPYQKRIYADRCVQNEQIIMNRCRIELKRYTADCLAENVLPDFKEEQRIIKKWMEELDKKDERSRVDCARFVAPYPQSKNFIIRFLSFWLS